MHRLPVASSIIAFAFLTACGTPLHPASTGPLIAAMASPDPALARTPTASPAATETSVPKPPLPANAWMSLPVVPVVSDTARAIYERGIEMGNDPHSFSKVGDCQSSTDFFLLDFDHAGEYRLGDKYAYLQSTIDYFGGSFSRQSKAVQDGFNVAAVLSPFRADPKACDGGESPLACEIRLHHPSVVIISLETNFNQQTADKYGRYLRQIVDYVIAQGAVPILATKADNLEGDNSINAIIAEIAYQYDIPLWNFWAAAHPLPNHGLDATLNDGFHISFARNFFDDPKRMESAWPWRNLTALQALAAVQQGLSGQ